MPLITLRSTALAAAGVLCGSGLNADEAIGSWVDVTPPGFSMDHAIAHGDNYGVQDILVDPVHPGILYAFSCYEGVWKSGDYGVTWAKVSTEGGPLDHGKAWGSAIAPDASYLLSSQGNGPDIMSAYRSVDGGVSWTACPTPIDPYMYDIDPQDKNHVVCSGHGSDHLAESTDGGLTWSDAGVIGTGASNYLAFVDSATLLSLSQGEQGTFRGVKSPSGWSWTKVSGQHHVHGSHQVLIERTPAAGPGGAAIGAIYNPGDLGIERSIDGGRTWTSISAVASNVIIATPTTIYAAKGYPSQKNVPHDPLFQHAARASGMPWTSDAVPAGMINGPKCMAVTTQGAHQVLVTGNWYGGIWRYVEASP